jgi:hypothetical protein
VFNCVESKNPKKSVCWIANEAQYRHFYDFRIHAEDSWGPFAITIKERGKINYSEQ